MLATLNSVALSKTLCKPNQYIYSSNNLRMPTVCKDTVISPVDDVQPLFSKYEIESKTCQKKRIGHRAIRFTGKKIAFSSGYQEGL